MVIQIGALKSGRDADVEADIARGRRGRPRGRRDRQGDLRERLPDRRREDPRLPPDRGRRRRLRQDLDRASRPSGATHDDLRLMRANTSPHIQVKAAGGVRTLDALLEVMALGVTRIGATADRDDHRRLPGAQGRRAVAGRGRAGDGRRRVLMATGRADASRHAPRLAWLDAARELLDRVAATPGRRRSRPPASWCADAIAADGLVHLFGTGHSRIPVEEMFPRYGSYPGFNPIVELSMTFHTQVVGANGQRQAMFIERTPGLAEVILVELHVRAEGRDDRVLGERPDGRAGRDGARRAASAACGSSR